MMMIKIMNMDIKHNRLINCMELRRILERSLIEIKKGNGSN
jgi:hypothetical protein